jgi:glycosyltransferase involved in cell wall biosynthesis
MTWQAANTFGWGVLGLNVFCQWAGDADVAPLMEVAISDRDLQWVDPLRRLAMRDAVARSNEFAEQIGRVSPREALSVACPVIHGLGNGFTPTRYIGSSNIGRAIFEDTRFEHFDRKTDRYDVMLVASTWARDLVRAHTRQPVHLIHEGVDPSIFFPGPRAGLDRDRFRVYSGGKVEYRKAQDLVVAAFRVFAARHADAVLVTTWHSPWPQSAEGYTGVLEAPLRLEDGGRIDATRWAVENGIPAAQFVDLGVVPNQLLPQVYREMDVALQPSRAEACTNLPAMEAMACGVPVILADNTGVRDLASGVEPAAPHCIALVEQGPVAGYRRWGTDGWGESSIEEILEALEFAYRERDRARAIGRRASAWILERGHTWADHARALKSLVLSVAEAKPAAGGPA